MQSPSGPQHGGAYALTVERERDALRAVLLRLGARVLDTDRWSGVEVPAVKTMLTGDERIALDFLPPVDEAEGPPFPSCDEVEEAAWAYARRLTEEREAERG